MQPSGVITITTDFGHKGPFAAMMKGVILSRFAAATIVDLAHDIPAQWPPEAGFWVRYSYRYFPRGSLHLAIVDPGVGTERDILLVEHDGHVFLAPDNGLLGQLLDDAADPHVYKLDNGRFAELGVGPASPSFHGRDIFAPIAAEIASGRIDAARLGLPTRNWVPGWLESPEPRPDSVTGTIVTMDAFGNLISNIDAPLIAAFEDPTAHIGGHDIPLGLTYGHARPGEFLALINSLGVVEIARAEGNAAESLGLERGAPIVIRQRPG